MDLLKYWEWIDMLEDLSSRSRSADSKAFYSRWRRSIVADRVRLARRQVAQQEAKMNSIGERSYFMG